MSRPMRSTMAGSRPPPSRADQFNHLLAELRHVSCASFRHRGYIHPKRSGVHETWVNSNLAYLLVAAHRHVPNFARINMYRFLTRFCSPPFHLFGDDDTRITQQSRCIDNKCDCRRGGRNGSGGEKQNSGQGQGVVVRNHGLASLITAHGVA